jgi:hypothetical protein
LPGRPRTPLWSPLGRAEFASGAVFPEGVTVGPDLLPGNPGTPGFDVPAAPGGLSWTGSPFVVTPCAQTGTEFDPAHPICGTFLPGSRLALCFPRDWPSPVTTPSAHAVYVLLGRPMAKSLKAMV